MGFFIATPAAAVSVAALRGKHPRRRWRRSAHGSGTHRTPTHQPPRAQSSPSTASHPHTLKSRHSKRNFLTRCTDMIKKLAFFNISLQRQNQKTMSKAIRIVVHCTGEPANARRNKEYYRHYFFDVKKWKHFGYHAVVYQDGRWEQLQPLPDATPNGGIIDNSTMACGAKGYNENSLHIAYVGGLDRFTNKPTDTRTIAQRMTLWAVIACWKKAYKITEVVGHNQLKGVTKDCPCFDAKQTYRNA